MEWNGRKLGLIGLVEREWLDTLATINPEEVNTVPLPIHFSVAIWRPGRNDP